jgi:uncharacterized protein YcaQ
MSKLHLAMVLADADYGWANGWEKMQQSSKKLLETAMNQQQKITVGRRNFLRVLCVGAGVAATPAVLVTEAKSDSENNDEKRKARYKADSVEVKTYYRVSRYPS